MSAQHPTDRQPADPRKLALAYDAMADSLARGGCGPNVVAVVRRQAGRFASKAILGGRS